MRLKDYSVVIVLFQVYRKDLGLSVRPVSRAASGIGGTFHCSRLTEQRTETDRLADKQTDTQTADTVFVA
jgi:hypothetical protein